jgi:hypothetical protein
VQQIAYQRDYSDICERNGHIFALNLGLGIFFERSRSKDLTTDSGRLQKSGEEETAKW